MKELIKKQEMAFIPFVFVTANIFWDGAILKREYRELSLTSSFRENKEISFSGSVFSVYLPHIIFKSD